MAPTAPPPPRLAPTPAPALSTPLPAAATPPPITKAPAPQAPEATVAPATLAPVVAPSIDHARVASLVAAGESAFSEGKLDEAGARFADALALDPGNGSALKGKARAATTRLGLIRTLVPDISSSEGAEGRLKRMDGFEDVEKMNVKRAAYVPGRAELDSPAGHLKPGDGYTVSIYLRNQSKKKKKNIKVSNVSVHRIVNDKDSVVTLAWNPVEVLPNQRALVATHTDAWEDDVSSWILNVRLLSESGDIYENRLVWE